MDKEDAVHVYNGILLTMKKDRNGMDLTEAENIKKRQQEYTQKLSTGHRTGNGQFSLQSQRRGMPENVQTTAQLHSFSKLEE